MSGSSDKETTGANELPVAESVRSRQKSARLVWAITAGEALLLAVCAFILSRYWMMLPIWMRGVGVAGLVFLGALAVLRMVIFYWKRK